MSLHQGLNGPCHHRTDGTESSEEDRQQAGCSSRGDRFTRRSGYPLRRRADTLAKVDAVRAVFRLNRATPTDLGACGCGPAHYGSARRWDRGQCRCRRALGPVSDRGSAARSTRRRTRIGTSRRPLRTAARSLRRDGSWLGVVPRPPTRALTGLCQRDCAPRRRHRDRCRGNGRSGFGSAARPPCAGRRRTRTPQAEHRTSRWPPRSCRAACGVDAPTRGTGSCRSPASRNGSAYDADGAHHHEE